MTSPLLEQLAEIEQSIDQLDERCRAEAREALAAVNEAIEKLERFRIALAAGEGE